MRDIYNDDVTSQSLDGTIKEISEWDVKPGSGTVEIHAYALKRIANELLFAKALERD